MSAGSKLIFRAAVAADAEKLVRLLSADKTGEFPNNPALDVPATLRCPAARIFVAELGDDIIGTITASWNGRNGELRYLWIAAALRSKRQLRSIFDGLVASAIGYLREAGMRRILMFVRKGPELQRQVRRYQRELGAEIVEPIVMVATLGDDHAALLRQ